MIKKDQVGKTEKNDVVTRFWYILTNLDPIGKQVDKWVGWWVNKLVSGWVDKQVDGFRGG